MMRGIITPIVALFAFVFLGRKQHLHHLTSIVLIVGGVALVGYSSLSNPDPDAPAGATTSILGLLLLCLS
jgi:drug/metabolite transporter (DMT)-like permease